MDASGYTGGIGGKFRRRLPRKAAATPYDRPSSAARGRRAPDVANADNGWLAKLVNPASRFIASSASWLFSSAFQKRLTASSDPEARGEEAKSKQIAEATSNVESQENKVDSATANNAADNLSSDPLVEFEQLLGHKTITRAQYEHLAELLRSRTIDLDTSEPAVHDGEVDGVDVSLPEKIIKSSMLHEDLTSHSVPAVTYDDKSDKVDVSLPENGTESSRLHDDLAAPSAVPTMFSSPPTIPNDEVVSPVELAKAYMGSRVSTESPSAISWQNDLVLQPKMPSNLTSITKPSGLESTRSVRFSVSGEIPEGGRSYLTPILHNRSAMYRRDCFPYSKGDRSSKDGHAGSLCVRTPESNSQLGGRQALKRRSSILDRDCESLGAIRRIRQKFNLTSSSKIKLPILHGNAHASPSALLKKNIEADSSLIQKPLLLDEHEEHEYRRISENAVASRLPESSEMGKKIFKQLDKLVSSSKEKSPKLKTVTMDGSPANVMHSFSGLPLKCSTVQMNVLDSTKDSAMPDVWNSLFHNQERIGVPGDKGPSASFNSGVKIMSEADKSRVHGKAAADEVVSDAVAISPCEKLDFKVAAPKVAPEVKDMHAAMDIPCPLENKNQVKVIANKVVGTSNASKEVPAVSTSRSIYSSSDFPKAADEKISNDYAPSSVQPSSVIMPSQPVQRLVSQKEQMAAPLFSFGSNDASRLEFLSTTTMSHSSGTSGLGNGVSNATASASLMASNDFSKSVGDPYYAEKPISNIPIVFSFGASRDENLSNASHKLSFAAPFMTSSGSNVSNMFSSSVAAFSTSTSVSSEAVHSTVPYLQFGSTSMMTSTSVSQSLDKSAGTDFEGKPGKASPYGINRDNAGSTTNFKFGGSSASLLASASLFPKDDNGTGQAASTSPTLFPSADRSQSTSAPASIFSGVSNSIFKSVSKQADSPRSANVDNNFMVFGSATATGFVDTRPTQGDNGTSHISGSSTSQFGSFYSSQTSAIPAPSSASLGSLDIGAAAIGANPFSSSSTFSFPAGVGSSGPSIASSFAPSVSSTVTSSTFQPPKISTFGAFGSSASSPSTGLIFGVSTPGNSPFALSPLASSSSGLAFGVSASGSSPVAFGSSVSTGQPVFTSVKSTIGFDSGGTGDDQMNVEDNMAEDTNQAAVSLVSQIGQAGSSSSVSVFGASVNHSAASQIFQFGSQQNNSSLPQSSPSVQSTVSPGFPQGGSFTLGTGGDKSGRKFVKVRRDRIRKK